MSLSTILYQLLHPWHWLTYGQNAAGVGLIVLIFYTIYTRRMMLLAQETRRGELYPMLILQRTDVREGYLELFIENVGAGALLNAVEWGQHVSQRFELGDTFLERLPEVEAHFAGTMVSKSKLTLNTNVDGSELRILQVVEGTDSFGGRQQFCVLRRYVSPGNYEYEVRMIHPTNFLPLRRRLAWKFYEWRARLQHKHSKNAH